ncbi:DUF2892 domain-containing protein [Pedobacter sp. AW1-32]|uniref:YgaP family membrane protein n=1 Tax=Pedobacter sp. AW1-32 TaxID=3383026 RepID=UPI003FF12E0C
MAAQKIDIVLKNVKDALKYPELFQNVSASERWLSGATGSYLLIKGLTGLFRHPVIGLTGAAIGAGLLFRGITGYCPVKDFVEQEEEIIPDEIIVKETYVVDDLS